jgi:hypothetical protein
MIWSRKSRIEHEVGIKTMPIDALPLSERTRNALIKNNILYVEDLEKKKKGELLLMKGVWRKAIDEIVSSLANINKALISDRLIIYLCLYLVYSQWDIKKRDYWKSIHELKKSCLFESVTYQSRKTMKINYYAKKS